MSSSTSSLFHVLLSVLSVLCLLSFSSAQLQNYGWYTDATATGSLGSADQVVNDLHCNPVQSFTTLPSAGAPFVDFQTYYIPSTVSVAGAVCRIGLYTVSASNVYTLLVGTQPGSDIALTQGSSSSATIATSGNGSSLLYGTSPAPSSVLIMNSVNYSLCFSNTALNLSGGAEMYLWPQATGALSYTYLRYYPSSPLPNPFPIALANSSTDTWQVWFQVQPPAGSYVQPLGWFADATAAGAIFEDGMVTNDLHCNPTQQFTQLPAAGGQFQSFATFYDQTSVSGGSPVVRMGLYQVVGSTWTLLVGTQAGSDLPLTAGSVGGGTLVTSSGSLYYPNGATTITVLPTNTYVICFTNNAGNISASASLFLWASPGVSQQNYAYVPYYLSSPLPTTYPLSLATNATDTWQMWINVLAVGTGPVGGTPTPVPAPAPPQVPADVTTGCYGLGNQTVWNFTYSYTAGCTPATASAFSSAYGAGCTAGNVNGTGGGWYTVTLTLLMLTSSSPVNGSVGQPWAAYQVCSLLPGSQRVLGDATSATNGFVPVWSTTPVMLVSTNLDDAQFIYNNLFYPYSAVNGANGYAGGPLGLQYYFDYDGIVYSLATSWQGWTFLNLATITGNAVAQGGTILQEETAAGALGVVNQTPTISVSSQPYVNCNSFPASTPRKTWNFNLQYTAYCNTSLGLAYQGCVTGGYYVLNLTLIIQTMAQPTADRGGNSSFLICNLLPGSQRTTTVSLNGGSPNTTTSAISLLNPGVNTGVYFNDGFQWDFNNYFYPYSSSNGPVANGGDGTLGHYYYFDNYGIVYQTATPWLGYYNDAVINLCTGNTGGSSALGLMEELIQSGTVAGQFGYVPNANSWSITVTPAQSYTSCPTTLGDQMVNVYSFNMVQDVLCGSSAAIPGCSAGSASSGQGYYTLNLTLNMLTSPIPTGGFGVQSGYQICQLLPGSTRTTYVSLTGGSPVYSSTPLSLAPLGLSNTGFAYDNVFFPYSSLNGPNGGTSQDPLNSALNYYFDGAGIVYVPSSAWLSTYTYINLCTSNPTAGSNKAIQLAEEDAVAGPMGVVQNWQIAVTSQAFAQQTSFYFCYSATGPLVYSTNSLLTSYATTISGTITTLITSTTGVYQIIGMTATRTITNFNGQTVASPVSMVGPGMAGNNNNLLYVNSSQYPLGMDGSGWGYSSTSTALFPVTSSTYVMAPANAAIALISGVVEMFSAQTTSYASSTMTIVPYMTGSMPSCSLPSSSVVATFTGQIIYQNQTVTVTLPGTNTTTVITNTTVVTNTVYTSSSSGSSLSNGAVAGIVIGCSIGLSLLCVLCLLCLLRRRDGKQTSTNTTGHSYSKSNLQAGQPSELSKVETEPTTAEVEMQ